MIQQPYLLDSVRRQVVLRSLQEVSYHRGWILLAAHVRTNHISRCNYGKLQTGRHVDRDENLQQPCTE
jgi:hypothetical protein